jgi:hypothetical protein
MLPDLRFVFGAAVAVSLLGLTTLGVFAAVRLAHQAKMGPLETSRNLAFADHAEWNPFYDPSSARLFQRIARPADPEPPAQRAAEAPPPAVASVAPVATVEPAAREAAGRIAASAVAAPEAQIVAAATAAPFDPAASARETASPAGKLIEAPAVETRIAAVAPAPVRSAMPPAAVEPPAALAAAPAALEPPVPIAAPPAAMEPPAPIAAAPAVAEPPAPIPVALAIAPIVAAVPALPPATNDAVPAGVVVVPPETAAAQAGDPLHTGTVAGAAQDALIATAGPADGVAPAATALSKPVYAKIEETVSSLERPPVIARPPKARAKKKLRTPARPAARAAAVRPRPHPAPRPRRAQQQVGQPGAYSYGNNPWPQARGPSAQNQLSGANNWSR